MAIRFPMVFGVIMMTGFGVTAAYAEPVTLEALLASSDVVLSESARSGVAIEIAAQPREILGGVGNGNGGTPPGQGGTPPGLGGGTPPGQGGTPPGQGGTPPGQGGGSGGGGLLTNMEFTTGVTGWTAINAYGGATSFGSVVPDASSLDGAFAVAHTGIWGAASYGSLEQSFTVSSSTSANFSVLYNFITTEWGSTSGAQFNDMASVTITNPDGTYAFRLVESAQGSQLFPVSGLPTTINGGRGQEGGQTGWVVGSSGPLVFGTGTYTIRIDVTDAADVYVDSAILVDRVGLQ
jgi:hypothetical protein